MIQITTKIPVTTTADGLANFEVISAKYDYQNNTIEAFWRLKNVNGDVIKQGTQKIENKPAVKVESKGKVVVTKQAENVDIVAEYSTLELLENKVKELEGF